MRTVYALLISILFAGLAIYSAELSAQQIQPTGSAGFGEVDGYVRSQMEDSRIPGVSLAIVRDDEIVHSRGFGRADSSGREVTSQTPFGIGSASKSFTALAVMQLVEAGKVDLDVPVRRYIPWFRVADPEATAKITVRHLLNHASGIPTTGGGEAFRSTRNTTPEQAVRELRTVELAHPPGEIFEYSNPNYVVLGLIVQEVSGQPYGEYVKQHIFEPLDMRDSYVVPEQAERGGMASGHRYWFGVPLAHRMPYLEGMLPAGYIISSAEDMGHYLTMYLGGGTYEGRTILSQKGIAEMHQPAIEATLGPWSGHHPSNYGMGWYIGGPWGQEPSILHRGAEPNFTSMMVLLPERETGVVVLMNAHNELPPASAQAALDDIPSGVVSLLLGQRPTEDRSLARFYLVFDLAALLFVGAQLWFLVRLLRRRLRLELRPLDVRRVLRLGLALLPICWEFGLGLVLLGAPALIGLSWPAVMLWMPDLALVLGTTGGLFLTIGAVRLTRITLAIAAARKQPAAEGLSHRSDTKGTGEPDDGDTAHVEAIVASNDPDRKGGRRWSPTS